LSSVCLVLWASLSEIKIDDGDDVDVMMPDSPAGSGALDRHVHPTPV